MKPGAQKTPQTPYTLTSNPGSDHDRSVATCMAKAVEGTRTSAVTREGMNNSKPILRPAAERPESRRQPEPRRRPEMILIQNAPEQASHETPPPWESASWNLKPGARQQPTMTDTVTRLIMNLKDHELSHQQPHSSRPRRPDTSMKVSPGHQKSLRRSKEGRPYLPEKAEQHDMVMGMSVGQTDAENTK